ncbi:MAG: S1-like domain-containing RNA-binding protein [Chitinophagales bacterium]|nr:S1-like domain-containing RNA-binding protein [Chitinophagales bacterium]
MLEIGRYNTLKVNKILSFGAYLDAGEGHDEILLPTRYIPQGLQPGDTIEVFVYRDSEDLLIATTETPLAQVGELAYLKCVQTTDHGAFMDWGLLKDLLVPFREQKLPLEAGRHYWVYVYYDQLSQRIAGSTKLNKFFSNEALELKENQEVELLVIKKTDLGYSVLIDRQYWGMLYHNEVFKPLQVGEQLRGYVKKIREDQKVDVSLQPQGYGAAIDENVAKLQYLLNEHGGYIALTDHSPAEAIYAMAEMSKKNFKKAVGALYKAGQISIEEKGIRLKKP